MSKPTKHQKKLNQIRRRDLRIRRKWALPYDGQPVFHLSTVTSDLKALTWPERLCIATVMGNLSLRLSGTNIGFIWIISYEERHRVRLLTDTELVLARLKGEI